MLPRRPRAQLLHPPHWAIHERDNYSNWCWYWWPPIILNTTITTHKSFETAWLSHEYFGVTYVKIGNVTMDRFYISFNSCQFDIDLTGTWLGLYEYKPASASPILGQWHCLYALCSVKSGVVVTKHWPKKIVKKLYEFVWYKFVT